jgi:hypothetical protein
MTVMDNENPADNINSPKQSNNANDDNSPVDAMGNSVGFEGNDTGSFTNNDNPVDISAPTSPIKYTKFHPEYYDRSCSPCETYHEDTNSVISNTDTEDSDRSYSFPGLKKIFYPEASPPKTPSQRARQLQSSLRLSSPYPSTRKNQSRIASRLGLTTL